MKYVHSQKFDHNQLLDVLNIDSTVYDKQYQGDLESVGRRFRAHEEMFIFAYDDDDKMVGYICFFPISDAFQKRIDEEALLYDDNIKSSDISSYRKGIPTSIFMISVAVLPDFRGKGVGFSLLKEMFSDLNAMSRAGCPIKNIYASAISQPGVRLLSRFNFTQQKDYGDHHFLMVHEFICFQKMDLYLFIPVGVDKNHPEFSTEHSFIEKLCETSRQEVSSIISKRIKRSFLGKVRLAIRDDYENHMDSKIVQANIFLSSYRDLGTLIVEVPSLSIDPTFILDQDSRHQLAVFSEEQEMLLNEYLKTLGIRVLGNSTSLLVSGQKLPTYYRQVVLFAEAYFNRIGSRIISEEASQAATTNIAQYEFADIYASGVAVSYELNVPAATYEERLQTSLLMLFIQELLSLRFAALCDAELSISTEFDQSPQPSNEIIENIIDNFGRYIILFDYDYKYYLAKLLNDHLAEKFGLDERMARYRVNLEHLSKIVSMRAERVNKAFSKKQDFLFRVVAVFTLLVSINNVISLFFELDPTKPGDIISLVLSSILWMIASGYLLITWLNHRKKK